MVFVWKIMVLEIWRVRAANRWYDGKTTYGHKTIKFTKPPYNEVSFFLSFCVLIFSMVLTMFLLAPFWNLVE